MTHSFNSLKLLLGCHPLNENYSDSTLQPVSTQILTLLILCYLFCFHSSYHSLIDYEITCLEMFIVYRSPPDKMGFPGGSDGKESACNAGELGLIPGSGISPGEGDGYQLQYSCLENFMDRGAWEATVHGVTKSWTPLSNQHS